MEEVLEPSKRPVGSLPPSKPPPARHRPGARSARWIVAAAILTQAFSKRTPTMRLLSWFDGLHLDSSRRRSQRGLRRKPPGAKLSVELLEYRTVPAFLTP